MKTDTRRKLLAYITTRKSVSAKDMAEHLAISSQALFKHLAILLRDGEIKKMGRPPKVFYSPLLHKKTPQISTIDGAAKKIIDERYLYISPSGEITHGWKGFLLWSEKNSQEPVKTAMEYIATLSRYDTFRKEGLIDGMKKMHATFKSPSLDALFYVDFYSIERFGKTKLGQTLLYAKQSQDKRMMRSIAEEVRPHAETLIKKYHIDGVLYIPPTVRREVQFMKELEKNLRLPVRVLQVTKIKTPVAVPQKTLTKLDDRIENARETIAVEATGTYKNILIIDDAVGSGATLNETAKQILAKKLCTGKIVGLVITGSYKGFDVISEV